jgi:hypothetical protein
MKGILDFLTSSSPAAMHLRQEFVVFIVPVLNPDGEFVLLIVSTWCNHSIFVQSRGGYVDADTSTP